MTCRHPILVVVVAIHIGIAASKVLIEVPTVAIAIPISAHHPRHAHWIEALHRQMSELPIFHEL